MPKELFDQEFKETIRKSISVYGADAIQHILMVIVTSCNKEAYFHRKRQSRSLSDIAEANYYEALSCQVDNFFQEIEKTKRIFK